MRILPTRKRVPPAILAALCLTVPCSEARGQDFFVVRDTFLGVNTGFAAVAGMREARSSLTQSMAFKFQAGREFRKDLAGGVEFGYNAGHKAEGAVGDTAYIGGGSRELFFLTPFVRRSRTYGLSGRELRLHGFFGLGVYRLPPATVPARVATGAGVNQQSVTLPSSTNAGFNFGGSLQVPIAPELSLQPDLRFHFLWAKGGNIFLISPAMGLLFMF